MAVTKKIVLLGAGNMGGAMLAGWLKSGIAGSSILILDPKVSDAMGALAAEHGVQVAAAPPEGMKADIIFLAVKPQIMDVALPPVKSLVGSDTVIVSIAAGKTLSFLEGHLGEGAYVRAMPNTPAMVGRGVTGAFANAAVRLRRRPPCMIFSRSAAQSNGFRPRRISMPSRRCRAAARPMFSISSSAWLRQAENSVCRRTSPCVLLEKQSRGLVNSYTSPPRMLRGCAPM